MYVRMTVTRTQLDKLRFTENECKLLTQSVTSAYMRCACNLHADERNFQLRVQGQLDGIIYHLLS
jgi:hypothetical protein